MSTYISINGTVFREMIACGAAQLKANVDEVNNLNVFPVPDGDTGDNMLLTITSGVKAVISLETEDIGEMAAAISRGMLLGARGNSGVILSQFFSGIAKGFEGVEEASVNTLSEAFQYGVKQAYKSVMNPTEGTILTVMREGVDNSVIATKPGATINSYISNLKKEMFASLEKTIDILPALKEAGVIDSGGAGLYYIFEGMDRYLSGEDVSENISVVESSEKTSEPVSPFDAFTEDSIMTYGYCTEFILRLQSSKVNVKDFDENVIKDYLKTVGDSIVSFKDGSIVKVHVHTMTPEKVLGFCRKFGEFLTMKIENMSVQHSEKLVEEKQQQNKKTGTPKEYGSVSVCSGAGIKKTFRELGTDYIIDGGQTNNPSTEDFIAAFDSVNARNIFVFPNNSNIILAARQAAEIYKTSNIYVVESKDLGSGYVGLASFNPEADNPEDMMEIIKEAMQNVVTGCVSPAVRTTTVGGVHIENGDYFCFVGKKMISSVKAKGQAAINLVDSILREGEKFMMTVFGGKETSHDDLEALRVYIKTNYPDVEVYMVDGGQDVYPFIIVAE